MEKNGRKKIMSSTFDFVLAGNIKRLVNQDNLNHINSLRADKDFGCPPNSVPEEHCRPTDIGGTFHMDYFCKALSD